MRTRKTSRSQTQAERLASIAWNIKDAKEAQEALHNAVDNKVVALLDPDKKRWPKGLQL